MSKDKGKLGIAEKQGRFYLTWFFGEEDGGSLGQSQGDGKGNPPVNNESYEGDWEHWAASRAVNGLPETQRDFTGFFWETRTHAKVALSTANEALKQNSPMPEWALTALANGWKAPKRWKA